MAPAGTVSFYDGGTCGAPGVTIATNVALTTGQGSTTTSSLSAGSHSILACYTHSAGSTFTDSDNSTSLLSLSVGKATPTITWNNPADITYGTALNGTQLNATASAGGSLVYTPASGSVLNAGNGQTLHVAFTPTDTANYANASKDVKINVNTKALTASITGNPAKPYDGNTTATLTSGNYSLSGLVGSDSISVTKTSGTITTAKARQTTPPIRNILRHQSVMPRSLPWSI